MYWNLILTEIGHFSITAGLAIILYRRYRMYWTVVAVFAAGFFIDADHLFDYFLYFGPRFNIIEFFQGTNFQPSQKIYLPFHGWEWAPVLLLTGQLTKRKAIFFGLAAGLLGHLIWDQLTNTDNLLFYSLLYRSLNHFSLQLF